MKLTCRFRIFSSLSCSLWVVWMLDSSQLKVNITGSRSKSQVELAERHWIMMRTGFCNWIAFQLGHWSSFPLCFWRHVVRSDWVHFWFWTRLHSRHLQTWSMSKDSWQLSSGSWRLWFCVRLHCLSIALRIGSVTTAIHSFCRHSGISMRLLYRSQHSISTIQNFSASWRSLHIRKR